MTRKYKTLILILVLLMFWIVTAPLLAKALIVEKPIAKADVIFVLSGSSVYKERTAKAAEVYRNGVAESVLLSDDGGEAGWSRTEERNPKFVELATQSLVQQGVNPGAIIVLDADVSGTESEAVAFAAEASRRGWKSVLIVTSAYHSRRALATFEKNLDGKGVKTGIAFPPTGEQTPPEFTWWLSPKGWRLVGGEYLKSLYYWVYY